jgi:hypothetical protein
MPAGEFKQLLLLLVVPSSETAAARCFNGNAASSHDMPVRTV